MSIVMMFNGERDIIQHLRQFTKFYEGLRIPLAPESKATVDAFFGKDGPFVLFCDKIFGKFLEGYYDDEPNMCWMDLANAAPNSPLASALFRCVSPNTPFVNFLEAISQPSPTFVSDMKSGWKSRSSSSASPAGGEERVTPAYTIDFPLSAFLHNSFRLLAESNDADLYAFTRSKITGALLLPFWCPPLATRKETSTRQTMTSLPCSPLAYFILRMQMYVTRRANKDGAPMLSRRQYRGLRSCIRYCEDTVAWIFNQLPPTEFPFFSNVFTAYIQTYVKPSLSASLSSKLSIQDVQWTAHDLFGALLISSTFLMTHRQVTQPLVENNRGPVYEPSQLAPIVCSLPFLTEMHIALYKGVALSQENTTWSVPTNFANDAEFKAADDLLFITRKLYRNCLVALRECIMSLDAFPRCRFMHFNNLLELWLTLLNPSWRRKGKVGFTYISRHYEAYSCITAGLLKLAVRSTMINTLDHNGVTLLTLCLTQLQDANAQKMATAFHSAVSAAGDDVIIAAVKGSRVLNWSDDQDSFSLMDLRSSDVLDMAAHLYALIEQKCTLEEFDHLAAHYRECLPHIERTFPGVENYLEKWRSRGTLLDETNAQQTTQHHRSMLDMSASPSSTCLTDEEKRLFFKGTRRSCARFSSRVKLPTNNGRVHGGHHPLLKSTMYLEFPFLIGPTRAVDAMIERLQEFYYSSWIPKCDRGHNMCLLNSDRFLCHFHPSETAMWECAICEIVYGKCCRGFPVTRDGTQLAMKRNGVEPSLCWRCGELLEEGNVCFASPQQTQEVLCPDCASRPFRPLSIRFMAAYSTWAVILVIFIAYYYIRSLFSDDGVL